MYMVKSCNYSTGIKLKFAFNQIRLPKWLITQSYRKYISDWTFPIDPLFDFLCKTIDRLKGRVREFVRMLDT